MRIFLIPALFTLAAGNAWATEAALPAAAAAFRPPAPPPAALVIPASRASLYPGEAFSPAEMAAGPGSRGRLGAEGRLAEFDFITASLERVYSHLENKQRLFGFSFPALAAEYRERIRSSAGEDDYRREVYSFIETFSDPHLGVRFSGPAAGRTAAAGAPIVKNALTEDGILLTRIERLYGTEQEQAQLLAGLDESLALARTARALVVDMRGNPGGNDAFGRYFISRLVAHPIPTGRTTVRISKETLERYGDRLQEDPARPGWGYWWEGEVQPETGESFKGPIALLIDGGCVSSCEGTAVMFKFSGAARLYGATTMGSSGYPAAVELPGGRGRVYIPTWIRVMPDGNPIEDHGVEPDVATEPAKALDRALADIRAALR